LLVGGSARVGTEGDSVSEQRLGLGGAQERVGQPHSVGVLPTQPPGLCGVLSRRVGAAVEPESMQRRGELVNFTVTAVF